METTTNTAVPTVPTVRETRDHDHTHHEERIMQAVVHQTFGTPAEALAIREIERPVPGEGEVLVEVEAAGVAKGDWLITAGLPYIARPSYGFRTPKQQVAGLELAGRVAAVGPNAARFQVGDEVFGWGTGAFAEYAVIPEDQLAPKPAGASFAQAAVLPVSGFAALQALRDRGEVAAGQRVLIIGASGGVGSFAVQIAKALGAEVTGVASTRNVELVRSLGADHVIDYTKEAIGDGGRRFDVIVDIAGNTSLSKLRAALQPRGTLVIVGGTGGRVTMGFGRTIRAMVLSPFVKQQLRSILSNPNLDDLVALGELVAAGDLTPHIAATYPLAEAPVAVEQLGKNHAAGKTAVTV
jgi:NADPH:quinone reductase-like Zn-dependent oxidoreductase